jgi:hypothetical protein
MDDDMKNALVKVIANHMKKSYLSWNKDTVKDDVIFEHLYELSDGKFDLRQSTEELLNTTDLLRISEFRIKSLHRGNLKFKVTKIQKQEK